MRSGPPSPDPAARSRTRRLLAALLVALGPAPALDAQEPRASAQPVALERDARERCRTGAAEDSTAWRGPGILLGRVVDATTRDPVPDALVWVGATGDARPGRWFDVSREGVFLLCGLSEDGEIHLQATAPGRISEPLVVESPGTGLALRDLIVREGDTTALAAARIEGGVLRGVVRAAETGEPLPGAVVEVVDTGSRATSNARGDFIFLDIPAGPHLVVTTFLGRTSDTAHVEVAPGELRNLAVLTLDADPVRLPELRVEIERWVSPRLEGFYRRLNRAQGHYITREDLEHRDVVGNFRRIPGARVLLIGSTGYGIRVARGISLRPCGPPLMYWNGALITAPSGPGGRSGDGGIGGGGAGEAYWESIGLGAFQRLQDFPRDLIEGIEVYRSGITAPAQYRMVDDICGVILVWTRDRRR